MPAREDSPLANTSWEVDPLIGALVGGRYRVKEILGRGGMGVVYGAVHEELGRAVAIKVVSSKYADEPRVIDRFLREAKTIAQIGHPNIVDVHDLGRLDDRRPYLVMERLYGSSFQELLREHGRMEPARVAELLEGAGAALEVVHAKGIIHRDIKPENLMLARTDDGASIVKLLDFGIALMANPSPDAPRITAANMIAGTPLYIAPEAAAGEALDHRADIYSLAVVAYHLLAGRAPFEGDTPVLVLSRKLSEVPPRLSATAGVQFAEVLEDVLARGLAREPARRYASARGLVQDIRAAAAGRPIETMIVRAKGHVEAPILGSGPWPPSAKPERAEGEVEPARGEVGPPAVNGRAVEAAIEQPAVHTSIAIAEALGDPRKRRQRALVVGGVVAMMAAVGIALQLRSVQEEQEAKDVVAASERAVEAPRNAPDPEVAAPVVAPPAPREAPDPEVAAPVVAPPAPRKAPDPEVAAPVVAPPAPREAPDPEVAAPVVAPPASREAPPAVAKEKKAAKGEAVPKKERPTAAARAPKRVRRTKLRSEPVSAAAETETPAAPQSARAEPAALKSDAERAPAEAGAPKPDPKHTPAEAGAPKADPERASLATRAGMKALVKGRLLDAVASFREAVAAEPRHAPAWRGLGLASERLGRNGEAVAAYKRYLALAGGEDPALVREVERRVKSLEQR